MATLVGIGLARFAYTPLIPVLVQKNWFSASDAVYLGEAILLGYFMGALLAHPLTRWFKARVVVASSLVAVALSFALCAWPASFMWFFAWRITAGLAGAVLIVVVPSMVLSAVPFMRRAMVATWVFSGIGIGAFLAATVIPLMLTQGLSATWGLLAGICLLAGWLCDYGVRHMSVDVQQESQPLQSGDQRQVSMTRLTVALVVVAYGLDAIGFIPHTVFWVDFLARQNNLGQAAASFQWALFGVGAALGPFVSGLVVHQLDWHRSLLLAFFVKAFAVLLPVLCLAWVSQTMSSLLVGALTSGLMAIVSGRLAQLVGTGAHQKVWGQATALFALMQAAGGFAMAAVYDSIGTALPLFILGSGVLVLGGVLIWASPRVKSRHVA